MGLGNYTGVTGYVGFSSSYQWDFTPNTTPASGAYDFVGVVLHEITEVMGRISLLNYQPSDYSAMDLFRYTSSGARDLTTGGSGSLAYFSTDGGHTLLNSWNNNPNNGDLGEWYGSGGNDAVNDYSSSGVINSFSATDITLMQALGWTVGTSSVPAAPVISGFSPDSGVLGDHITNATTLTVSGTAVANSTVTVYDRSSELGTTTADGSGNWGYTTGTLSNGSHSFTATDTVSGSTSGASTAFSVTIDTVAPTVSSLIASGTGITNGSGDLNAGKTVTLTLSLSEVVTVAGGTPSLTLNDGATATYTGGSGTSALTFSYTVAASENTADLAVTAISLNGATVTDVAGNTANLAGAVTNPAGILQIDTTVPSVSLVTTSGTGITNGSGDLGVGSVVTFTVNLSEAVNVTGGTPTLTLNDGATATYTGGSNSNALTFSYTVATGQNTADLSVTAVQLNGATVADGQATRPICPAPSSIRPGRCRSTPRARP